MRLARAKSVAGAAAVTAQAVPVINHSFQHPFRRIPLSFASMQNSSASTGLETKQQKFETIVSREVFTGLKAILDSLSPNRDALSAAVSGTNSYEELLGRLGYPYGQKTRNWSIHKDLRYGRKVALGLEHWFTFTR